MPRNRLTNTELVFMQDLTTYRIPDLEDEGLDDVVEDFQTLIRIVRRLIGSTGPGPRRTD